MNITTNITITIPPPLPPTYHYHHTTIIISIITISSWFHFISSTSQDVTAYPDSVNVLQGVTDDVRTPAKLIDGVNDTDDGRHMWLAPVFPGLVRIEN